MPSANHKYVFNFRWGNFQLRIVGRRNILWWIVFASSIATLVILKETSTVQQIMGLLR